MPAVTEAPVRFRAPVPALLNVPPGNVEGAGHGARARAGDERPAAGVDREFVRCRW